MVAAYTAIPTAHEAAMNRLRAQHAAYALHLRYDRDDLIERQRRGAQARWLRLAREYAAANGEGPLDDAEAQRRADLLLRQHMTKARMAGLAKQRGVQPATIQRVRDLAHPPTVCPTCWRAQHPRKAWPASYSTTLCTAHAAAIVATHTTANSQTNTTNDPTR